MCYWKPLFLIFFITHYCSPRVIGQDHIKLAYYGETIIHYGLRAGYESAVMKKQSNKKVITVDHQLLWSGNISIYRHPHNHTGLILSPEVTYRHLRHKRGGFYEISLAPALFRDFYAGSTYRYNDNKFEKIPLAGRFAFLPTLSIGGGRDLSFKKDIPYMWYWRINYMRQYPYNIGSLIRIAIEFGIIKKVGLK